MSDKVLDRRVQKTRQLLKDALVSLISEKGFDAVTIQEILDRANVGRSTFYFHYQDKQDLLHSCFEDFNILFAQYDTSAPKGKKYTGSLTESDFTLNFLKFVANNHRLFKALLGKDGVAMFIHPVHELVLKYVNETLKASVSRKMQSALQLEIQTHYLASAFIGTLRWWIDADMPCTAEELNKYFIRFAAHDINNI